MRKAVNSAEFKNIMIQLLIAMDRFNLTLESFHCLSFHNFRPDKRTTSQEGPKSAPPVKPKICMGGQSVLENGGFLKKTAIIRFFVRKFVSKCRQNSKGTFWYIIYNLQPRKSLV